MQNYHTPNSGPLTAILEVIRDADPQHGMTAIQIARATGLNLIDTVIPALRGFIRSKVITGSPEQQQDGTSYILNPAMPLATATPAQPGSAIVTCQACGGSGTYLPGMVGMPCVSCCGTGWISMPPTPGPLVDVNSPRELEAHLVDERLLPAPERPACQGCKGTGSVTTYALGMHYPSMCLDCGGTGLSIA